MRNIAKEIASEIIESDKPKKIKVRGLIKKFGFLHRSEESSRKITQLLAEFKIYLNPSIMKIEENWKLSLDDKVTLSHEINKDKTILNVKVNSKFNDDKWFDQLENKFFRTEREVETKFIIPLLYKLDYSENDRFDGMTFKAYSGSRPTILETDSALFDSGNELLANQVLLVVEAKREDRLTKEVELEKAQKQTKSYAIWLSCHFGLVTDGRKIQVLDLFPNIGGINVLFDCQIKELKERFIELYNLIGKNILVKYYENIAN
ncbi:MAG: restriction endonuclease subunit R [Ignavibacteriota bacterium]